MAPKHTTYVGSGPYCYANSLAMMMGRNSPSTAVIEFATSGTFGMQFIGNDVVFFDAYGWDPAICFDAALKAAGWESTLVVGADATDALERLKAELEKGQPVFIGPLEMGLLRYQPEMSGAIGADHYVVVLSITDDMVELHDPHGHPYATLPVSDFMNAWKAEKIAYGKPYMMRTDFRQVEPGLTEEDIIRRSLSNARRWLSMEGDYDMPPGSCGNGEAAIKLAEMMESAQPLSPGIRMPLIFFAVKVGARRLADAATCMQQIGRDDAANILTSQARLVGALQYSVVVKDYKKAASLLRQLAPTYEALKRTLEAK